MERIIRNLFKQFYSGNYKMFGVDQQDQAFAMIKIYRDRIELESNSKTCVLTHNYQAMQYSKHDSQHGFTIGFYDFLPKLSEEQLSAVAACVGKIYVNFFLAEEMEQVWKSYEELREIMNAAIEEQSENN